MKKRNGKAFTIVELVIVIAVIAILAAVLVPTFSNIIKKAQISKDTQLVRNLNSAVAIGLAESGKTKFPTAYDAMEAVVEAGYLVERIVATSDYDIAWSRATGNFVLIDTENKKAVYPTTAEIAELVIYDAEDEELDSSHKDNRVDYFIIRAEMPKAGEDVGYSIFAGSGWKEENVELNAVGFDAGYNTEIKSISYTNNASGAKAKDVVIRTNGGSLTINDTFAASHQYHYGYASSVTVATGSSCYECHAIIKSMTITAGKAIADEGAAVAVVEASSGVKLEEINGGVFYIPDDATTSKINSDVAAQIGYTISGATITPSTERAAKAEKAQATIESASSGSGSGACDHKYEYTFKDGNVHEGKCSKCNDVVTEKHDSKGAEGKCSECGEYKWLTFTALSNESAVSFAPKAAVGYYYFTKINGVTSEWNEVTGNTRTSITLNQGDSVSFKGSTAFSKIDDAGFIITGQIIASGDITCLANGRSEGTVNTSSYSYSGLFYEEEENADLVIAPEISTSFVQTQCYKQMFYQNYSLITAPKITVPNANLETWAAPTSPGTIGNQWYNSMFDSCSNLHICDEYGKATLSPGTKYGEIITFPKGMNTKTYADCMFNGANIKEGTAYVNSAPVAGHTYYWYVESDNPYYDYITNYDGIIE